MNTLTVGFGSCWIRFNERVFLGVVETIVGSLLCCGVDIVQCLFNLLCYIIGDCNLLQHLHRRACFRGGGGPQLGEVTRLSIQSLILI